MGLSITSFLAFAATSGVIAALVNQAFNVLRDWWTDARRRKEHAGYHALRLAIVLEAYSYSCSEFVLENANAQTRPGEQYPDWNIALPKLPPYPEDAEGWRAIELKLAASTLNFQNKIYGSQSSINTTIDFTPDELDFVLDEQAASRGIEAWEIATALRKRYALDQIETAWNFIEIMRGVKFEAQKSKKEARDQQAALMESHSQSLSPPEDQ